jgi:predicted Fe-Mo cluster-binding NifX family protein
MKIFLTVKDKSGLDSQLDSRFGRAGYFLIYDTDKKDIVVLDENSFRDQEHGVGIKVANYIIESGCQLAIGPQPGPKAADILNQSSITVLVEDKGTVKEMLEKYQDKFLG